MMPAVNRPIPVHRIPHHVRDDRDTPLTPARNGEEEIISSEKAKEDYFCAEVLKASTSLMRFANFESSRGDFCVLAKREVWRDQSRFARRARSLASRRRSGLSVSVSWCEAQHPGAAALSLVCRAFTETVDHARVRANNGHW